MLCSGTRKCPVLLNSKQDEAGTRGGTPGCLGGAVAFPEAPQHHCQSHPEQTQLGSEDSACCVNAASVGERQDPGVARDWLGISLSLYIFSSLNAASSLTPLLS